MKFNQISGVVLDMDGVLWRGDQALPGFHDTFAWFDEQAIPYALLTNNSGSWFLSASPAVGRTSSRCMTKVRN